LLRIRFEWLVGNVKGIEPMNEAEKSWPKAISLYLEKTGQTQKQLAEALGVEPITVNRWKTGKTEPKGTTEMILTAALAVHGISVAGKALKGVVAAARSAGAVAPLLDILGAGFAASTVIKLALESTDDKEDKVDQDN
jgi:transcriptional regulator with XRE-family HTH domain